MAGLVTFDPTHLAVIGIYRHLAPRRCFSDALEVFWQDWVMSYDLERQILIADRIGQNRAVLAGTGRARDSTPSTCGAASRAPSIGGWPRCWY